MYAFNTDLRVILIGGTSNVGKSTVAQMLAEKLGWHYIATDYLARHPGRPWRTPEKEVPPHVAEHYLTLSLEELITDVLRHYKNLLPQITATITQHATDLSTDCLIMEGSALWPESIAPLNIDKVGAIWLTASNDLFQHRMYTASQYEQASPREKEMVDKFLGRTKIYNERMMDAVNRLGLASLNVEEATTLDELAVLCLDALQRQG